MSRVFLLSPADCSGKRARQLCNPRADHDLARQLHGPSGAEVGSLFSFMSALYFRGKLAYARAFARASDDDGGIHVITPGDGLLPPGARLKPADIERYAGIEVDPADDRYSGPLRRDLAARAAAWADVDVVLLGSIASGKYAEILQPHLGDRLLFPADFVGRGDMSRGGLMLRCVREGRELAYIPIQGAVRRGSRPPRLPPA